MALNWVPLGSLVFANTRSCSRESYVMTSPQILITHYADAQDISVKKRRQTKFLRTYAEIGQLSTCKKFGSTASSGRRLLDSCSSTVDKIECGANAAAAAAACVPIIESGSDYIACVKPLISNTKCVCSCVQSLIGFDAAYCAFWP